MDLFGLHHFPKNAQMIADFFGAKDPSSDSESPENQPVKGGTMVYDPGILVPDAPLAGSVPAPVPAPGFVPPTFPSGPAPAPGSVPAPTPASAPVLPGSGPGAAPGAVPAPSIPASVSPASAPGTKDLERMALENKAEGKQALDNLALVQDQGGRDVKAARDEAAAKQDQASAALAQKQAETNKHNAELDAAEKQALTEARDYTIPDFWGSNYGKMTGAAITVALSGIGAGLLGSTQNQALTVVQHNIDSYFAREKEKIDNKFKYAAELGKLNDKQRTQWQQEFVNLKEQYGLVIQAAKDRVEGVAAESKGAADAATTKTLVTKLNDTALEELKGARALRSNMILQANQAKAAAASAEESLAGAALKRAQANDPNLGKTPSGEMLKAQGFAETARAADKVLQSKPLSEAGAQAIRDALANEALYETKFLGLGPAAKAIAMKTGEYQSAEQKLKGTDKEAYLAIKQFINADLRRESGSAIGVSEFDSALSRYFRAPGDNDATLKQKDANRLQAIRGMDIAAGKSQPAQVGPSDQQAQLLQMLQTQAAAGSPWAIQALNGMK